jgi:Cu+-exporting ATPase
MKPVIISIIVAVALIGGALFLVTGDGSGSTQTVANSANLIDGKQVIEISAKGGYSPKTTFAKAGTPTIIKMKTEGTFDCSSAVSIPSLNYRKNLQPSGITEIEVPPQKAGTTLQGLCAMGMYNLQVKFN